MSDAPDDELVVFSDYVCPFCYLGKQSLEAYREERDDPPDVEWLPFDLRGHKRGPDGEIRDGVDDGKDEAYFEQARENVRRLKEEYDADGMRSIDEVDREIDSWNAQQAALSVRRSHDDATFLAFHDALFAALWEDGRDVGDPDVLADVAADVGVDPDEVRDAVADEDLEAELRERFADARQAGVSAVPTFVYDEHAARGAVPPSQLERLVEGA